MFLSRLNAERLMQVWDYVSSTLNSRRLPIAVNLILIIILILGLVNFITKIITPIKPLPLTTSTKQPNVDSNQFPVLNNKSQRYERLLFGQNTKQNKQENISLLDLPKTQLNLTLTGTIVAGPRSMALISVNGRAELPIMIGQKITDEVTLKAVYPKWITIVNSGKYEQLQIKAHTGITRLDSGSIASVDTDANGNPAVLKKTLPARELRRTWDDILKRRQDNISKQ